MNRDHIEIVIRLADAKAEGFAMVDDDMNEKERAAMDEIVQAGYASKTFNPDADRYGQYEYKLI